MLMALPLVGCIARAYKHSRRQILPTSATGQPHLQAGRRFEQADQVA